MIDPNIERVNFFAGLESSFSRADDLEITEQDWLTKTLNRQSHEKYWGQIKHH